MNFKHFKPKNFFFCVQTFRLSCHTTPLSLAFFGNVELGSL